MSYNGSGVFSALSTFTSNTTISSSAMNALIADIASGLSACVVKDGQQSLTGAIRFASGTAAAPSITFGSDTDCGLYRIGADNVGLAIGGTKILDISSTGVAITGAVTSTGAGIFPSGTAMLFVQTSAPTGWTKSTTHNDKALRVVSGTASSGGSVAFSTVFGNTATGSYTLTTTDMPAHTHTGSGTTSGQSADHSHTGSGTTSEANIFVQTGLNVISPAGATQVLTPGSGTTIYNANHSHTYSFTTSGASVDHSHTYSFTTSSAGGGGGHTHALDLRVTYVDCVICTKD